MMVTRRAMLAFSVGALAVMAGAKRMTAAEGFEVMKSEAEWRKILTPAQYRVLREEDTERAGSSPLDREKRKGTFHCAGCDLPLYSSKTKYDSGTGWPSFWEPLPNAIGTKSGTRATASYAP